MARTRPRGEYSYGGCNTCRRRHVKCDKARPNCLQCRRIGESCEGFPSELKWVVNGGVASSGNLDSRRKLPRRQLHANGQLQASIITAGQSGDRLDKTLSSLEDKCKDIPSIQNKFVSVGPFGVFDAHGQPARSPAVISSLNSPSNASRPRGEEDNSPERTSTSAQFLGDVGNLLDWPDLFDLDSPFNYFSQHYPDNIFNSFSIPPNYPLAVSSNSPSLGVLEPPGNELIFNRFGGDKLGDDPICKKTSIENLSQQDAQLLLKHLKHHCIPHMWSSPIGKKSPLEFHLDAAIATLAQVTFLKMGDVSHASLANLLSLLSISSKHLAAQGGQGEELQNMNEFAERNAGRAQEHLACSLKHEISPKLAKYKDLVMAVSSVLAFSILYDRQKEARAYLIDSERLLRTLGLAKRCLSRRAKLLHHTYTWNRILGESTYVLRKYDNSAQCHPKHSSEESSGERIAAETRPGIQNPKLDDFLHLESLPPVNNDAPSNANEGETLHDIHLQTSQGKSESTFLLLYGVSETWLSLLSQTTRLANVMESLSSCGQRPDTSLLDSLERRKQQLENKVCSFAVATRQSDPPHHPSSSTGRSSRSALIQALNSALVIFFYRRIRNVNPWILQHHVGNVIQALKAFDAACEREGVGGPGSPWPAFMAGCEAMTPEQRDFFTDWMSECFSKTGFSRLVTAKKCMKEVWSRQDRFSREDNDKQAQDWTWIQISKEQDLYVLLS